MELARKLNTIQALVRINVCNLEIILYHLQQTSTTVWNHARLVILFHLDNRRQDCSNIQHNYWCNYSEYYICLSSMSLLWDSIALNSGIRRGKYETLRGPEREGWDCMKLMYNAVGRDAAGWEGSWRRVSGLAYYIVNGRCCMIQHFANLI